MTATNVRPDYDPSQPNGAAVAAAVAVLLVAATAVAGIITVLIFILDGIR